MAGVSGQTKLLLLKLWEHFESPEKSDFNESSKEVSSFSKFPQKHVSRKVQVKRIPTVYSQSGESSNMTRYTSTQAHDWDIHFL